MMKRLILVLCVVPSILMASYMTESRQYVEAVSVNNQKEIYNSCILWISQNFRSTSVIKYKTVNKIVVKGIAEYYQPFQMRKFRFTMIIDIKPGKLRFTFNRFSNTSNSNLKYKPSFKKAMKVLEGIKRDIVLFVEMPKENDGW